MAPVRVAKSIMWVAPLSAAAQRPSERTRRPSASVLPMATVLPFLAVKMSPGSMAPEPVFGKAKIGRHFHGEFEFGCGADGGKGSSRSAHVADHFLHSAGGF